MKNKLTSWCVGMAACTPLMASAQAAGTEAPKATARLTYQSAFADYKPYKDVPLADWRAVNDTVAGAAAKPAAAGPRHEGHAVHPKQLGGKP